MTILRNNSNTDSTYDYLEGPLALREEKPQVKKDRLPVPLFRPVGKKILCLRDPEETQRGRIIIPQQDRQKYRPTVGTVVAIGDGYDPESGNGYENWEDWSPIKVGERVLWGRFDGDLAIRIPVEESWWDSPEEKTQEDGKVEVTMLHIKQVLGVLTSDEG